MSIKEIHIPKKTADTIFQTYYLQLSTQPRYERFMTGESLDKWTALLGPDVRGLTHPHITASIEDRFVNYNEWHGMHLSAEEQSLLGTAPWVHDLGEIVFDEHSVGDISFDQKTATHEEREKQIFARVLECIPDGPEKALMQQSYEGVALDKESKLGRMFNAIERIGYLETAVRAWKGVGGERIGNWVGLVGNVLSNQVDMLLTYMHEYPYVAKVLDDNFAEISMMLKAVPARPAPLDKDGRPSYDAAKLLAAKNAWRKHETIHLRLIKQ